MKPALRLILDSIAADLGASDFSTPQGSDLWAKPFVWVNPAILPPRQWIYRPHFIRGYVTATFAAGGAGKTTLTTTEALSVASGRPLLGVTPPERCRVWLWNGEDPADEIQRRIQAAMLQHDLSPPDVEDWLFTGSGRDADLVIAEQTRDGSKVARPVVDALVEFIRAHDIGVVIIDPFVSCHRVLENDNGAIDQVAKAWAQVAHETGCAVHLVHHTRKTNGQDATVEDGRGASALLSAVRYGRALNIMSKEEARRLGVDETFRRLYVRIDEGKQNLTPPAANADWIKLASVELGNGDNVQAAVRWTPPNPGAALSSAEVQRILEIVAAGHGGGGWRLNSQAGEWVGLGIARALGLDIGQASDKVRVKALINVLLKSGRLIRIDRSIGPKGKFAPFVEVGDFPHLDKVGGGVGVE